jgi:hypothetical protein
MCHLEERVEGEGVGGARSHIEECHERIELTRLVPHQLS